MSNKDSQKAPQSKSTNKICHVNLTLDNIEPKLIKPAGNSLNGGLAFRLKKFSHLVLPLDKRVNVNKPKRSKSNEALIVPAISSLKLNRYKPATADMNDKVKRFTRKTQKKAIKSESLDTFSVGSLKNLVIDDDCDNVYEPLIDDVDVEGAQESSQELIHFQEKIDGNDQDSPPEDQKESVHSHESSIHCDESRVHCDETPISSLIGIGKEISQEKANSDIATDGDLFLNEFADRKPTDNIYVLPEFPSSKLFINQAKNILKGVGPKTRKDILERETLLQKQRGIFNKYAETRRVLGYGPNLGVQRQYQSDLEGPPVITVSLRKPLGVKSAAGSRLKKDQSPKGIHVIRNSSKKSRLPDISYF